MSAGLPAFHGFRAAPNWEWTEIACANCGFHEVWADLRDDQGGRPRNRGLRAKIRSDMEEKVLRSRGCRHV